MHRHHRVATLTATVLAGALFATGCSSSSGGKKSEDSAAGVSAGKATTPRMTVALVTHQAPGDTFWDTVRKGAEAAAAKDNIKLVYSSDPNAGNQANLLQNAIDQKVDGIAATLAKPDAMKDVVAKAEQAGIPVVGLNAGLSDWKKLGLLEYFGQDENVAGEAFGKKLNEVGAKHSVCVIQEQGNVALEQRCAGVKKTFSGKTEILYVNGTDMPSVKSTVTAKLSQEKSIDEVVTLAGAGGRRCGHRRLSLYGSGSVPGPLRGESGDRVRRGSKAKVHCTAVSAIGAEPTDVPVSQGAAPCGPRSADDARRSSPAPPRAAPKATGTLQPSQSPNP
ncbi:substrate-binding domain-containing protein [Streptomyces sp. NPDC001634]|uniref:substrate-binding domain-containing protein n=1 Tax=Streptomyces sp. NPDC001634 TaxID=3154390 RepID=UPI00331B0515